ncbi:EamA family transporter [Saccharibacter sp. 17.LH.SD]|uniref:DMT family transporter n=1 Tax=Saccharibacter sp. 17.LH.SD TaxID=2689393 RepID=UPI0013700CF3|nr:DMT family transporter [Saccharibacter sp. 17.LH.SD]MXV44984.1 EamA family transporter [Saccharibacter sp. 17.LH.SD]
MRRFRVSLPTPQELSLGFITILWGGTYYVLHIAMQSSGPLFFVGARFVAAALIVSLLTGWKSLRKITASEIRHGCLIGAALVSGFALQSSGLMTISSSRSAFLTALYVPLVPILQWIILRRAPSFMSWIGIGCAVVGLTLISNPFQGSFSFGRGDALTLVATVAMALEILFIGMFAGNADSRRITIVQLVFGAILAFAAMPLFGEHVPSFSWGWASCALGMGLLSAVVQLVMNWAQRSVSPTRATMIYATEPVWGGLVGYLVGEALPSTTLLGAAFIVGGVVCSEIRPNWPRLRRTFRGAVARGNRIPAMSEFVIRDFDEEKSRQKSSQETR